jgi:hypothetical protein
MARTHAKSPIQSVVRQSADPDSLTLADTSNANAALVSVLNCSTPEQTCVRSAPVDIVNQTTFRLADTLWLGINLAAPIQAKMQGTLPSEGL